MIKIGDKVKIKTKLYLEFLKFMEIDLKKIYTVKQIMYNRFLKRDIVYLEGKGFFLTREDLTKVNCLELE